MRNLDLSILTLFSTLVACQSWFSPIKPPSFPLAVKSPYLSVWLPAGGTNEDGGILNGAWPTHWSSAVAGWCGQVMVDGETYTWMGNLPDTRLATQKAAIYTSTKTVFDFTVQDKIRLKATFLSPVFPHDYRRQSLVMSYLNVEVKSMDGSPHAVALYTDISGEWASGDGNTPIKWESGTEGNVTFHRIQRQNELTFSEIDDHAEWGEWYYGTTKSASMTYQSGAYTNVRTEFQKHGRLNNVDDTEYRAINDDVPVFGFAVDLGSVTNLGSSVLFTVGLAQEYAVQFQRKYWLEALPSLWKDYFENSAEALNFFHNDFEYASKASTKLDEDIARDSIAASGPDLLTSTSLAFRQAFASTQLTGVDYIPWLWMKEISSNGNTQTVDVIFPMHPILLYTNPELLWLMLKPHFIYQTEGLYPNEYAVHDLGLHYPNATGHPTGDDEAMPVEECANMLIMTLAYMQRTNSTTFVPYFWQRIEKWGVYLTNHALLSENQLSTDDFLASMEGQTNLALKGIIAMKAASHIANMTGHEPKGAQFSTTADRHFEEWLTTAVSTTGETNHTMLKYGDEDSWVLLYNLYADKLLSLSFVPQEIYDMQSRFYPTVSNKYGVPLDTRGDGVLTKSDWQMFAAAVASPETRQAMVSDLAKWIGETPTNRPMTDLFDTRTGEFPESPHFYARPVVGGFFALLALHK